MEVRAIARVHSIFILSNIDIVSLCTVHHAGLCDDQAEQTAPCIVADS